MPPHRYLTITLLLAVVCLLTGSAAPAADLSFCTAEKSEIKERIRCALWDLTAYMLVRDGEGSMQRTGKITLDTRLWAQAEAHRSGLRSPWPDQVRLKFYEQDSSGDRLVEEIVDSGLDGLSSPADDDAYLRHVEGAGPVDLLGELDPKLLSLMNREYAQRLAQLLSVLKENVRVHGPLAWRAAAPGLESAVTTAYRYIRLGITEISVLRIDPEQYALVPFHYLESEGGRPKSIEQWGLEIPRATVLLNSGQYYPDYRYIGLLYKDGRDLGTGLHPSWKALLLSGGPVGRSGRPSTDILDLNFNAFEPKNAAYRYAVQSFMLLDHRGQTRVRKTDRLASRTVIGQDKSGRILIVFVPGACTLYELAAWLVGSELDIHRAMCLDGGFESQLLIRDNPGQRTLHGAWVVNDRRQSHMTGLRLPLPSVIAVMPHQETEKRTTPPGREGGGRTDFD